MKQRLLLISLLVISLSLQAYSKGFLSSINSNNPFSSSDDSKFRHIRTSSEIYSSQTSNNFNEDYQTGTDGTDSDDLETYVPVMALSYYGNWYSSGSLDTPQLDYFSESLGYAAFTADNEGGGNLEDGINVWIYDGQYKDQKGAYINFIYNNDTDFNPQNSSFSNSNITFNVTLLNDGTSQNTLTCTGSYQMSLIDSSTNAPYQASSYDYDNAVIQFQISSPDCNLSISMSAAVDSSAAEEQAMEYTIMVTIICVGHLYACIQMIRQISLSETDGARYSLITFGIFTAWDVFLCAFHFYGALTTEIYFHYFITPAFWYFILASILEARLLLLIWKGKYYHSFQDVQSLNRGLSMFYIQFYGFLGVFLLACYFFVPDTWFLYVTSFFFVPQIIHNAIRGQKYKFDANFIFLLGVLRIFVPLYVKSYPGSMFRYTPNDSFAIFYIGIVLSQVVFLHLQSKIGSRFFVPAWLLPPVHNYFVKVPITGSEEADVCAICMEDLDQESSDLKTELVKNEKFFTVMQTPCKHNFHEKCLKEWMEIKLECPFCRTNLPAIE